MKKSITLLAFLCLAVGTTSAKDIHSTEGVDSKIEIKKLEYAIPYIPVENYGDSISRCLVNKTHPR